MFSHRAFFSIDVSSLLTPFYRQNVRKFLLNTFICHEKQPIAAELLQLIFWRL